MSFIAQAIRDVPRTVSDRIVFTSGYIQGRFPNSLSDLWALSISKVTRLVSIPLPFLSFLALPFFSGTSTTINLVFFYLIWSTLVLSNDPLSIEIYGTLLIRVLCFLLPAIGFVLFDSSLPGLSRGIKNRPGQLPFAQLTRNELLKIVGVAALNVLLGVALQGGLELFFTEALHLRSILKVTTIVPLPWNILKHVAFGFVIRGIIIYLVHRYLLHTVDSSLKTWHIGWQHSAALPFSVVAAYDHPINYLLLEWLPAFLPAYLMRFHVLTWHLFIALCSLEELFVYSGYSVLPSSIVLLGMARRNDEHFASVAEDREVGNFGRLGILDFVCGTICKGEGDVADDIEAESRKHGVKQRAEGAVDGAISGIKGKQKSRPNTRAQRKAAKS